MDTGTGPSERVTPHQYRTWIDTDAADAAVSIGYFHRLGEPDSRLEVILVSFEIAIVIL
jgi:hypothetical protein